MTNPQQTASVAADCSEKFAIIGAGPVGLSFAKALKRHGIPYDHFEADDALGGNWYHGVYDSAHIISSKKTTEFSDFPMPDSYPDFPSRTQMLEYLQSYARTFDIENPIAFNTKISRVRPSEDDLWELTFESGEQRNYKGAIVCIGHHWDPFIPEYPGAGSMEVIHSKEYKHPEQLRDKRVLVVGGGNSACDIVAEAARVAKSAHLSIRRGHWFMPKTMFGVPTVEFMRPWMPMWLQRIFLGIGIRVAVGDYRRYGLPKPDHKIFETHPTINSELLHYLKHGRITPHPGIARFDGNTVEFVDGVRESFDLIVFATGYHVSFPLLPPGLVEVRGAVPQVYAGGVLPNYKHLYIVGSLQVRYGFGPLLSPYSDLFCELMKLQDRMVLPIGRVIQRVGQKIPQSHLVCPFQALRAMKRARRLLPLLVLREKQLRRREPMFQNVPIVDETGLFVGKVF